MTHALDIAKATNDAIGGTPWETDVAAHLTSGGHFLASAGAVCLWRPVCRDWDDERLCNPWDSAPEGNAWYVWMTAGPDALRTWAALATSGGWPVKDWVAFHRRGTPKWYRTETILRRITHEKAE